jgi:hypothetical protein
MIGGEESPCCCSLGDQPLGATTNTCHLTHLFSLAVLGFELGFVHARQELYHLSHSISLSFIVCYFYFWGGKGFEFTALHLQTRCSTA